MPISTDFQTRLYPHLETIAAQFGTPFHIYDEIGIRQGMQRLRAAFSQFDYHQYFAVKATPNPRILQILKDEKSCFDCSSIAELILARRVGASGHDLLFTSNNTTSQEFDVALSDGGSILNLDDDRLLDKLPYVPDMISFRLNPGSDLGNAIIGKPQDAKFGIPKERYVNAYQAAQDQGVKRFGLHMMAVSNERDVDRHLAGIRVLLEIARQLHEQLGIVPEFINIGGGLGIPYHPDDIPLPLEQLAVGIWELWQGYDFLQNAKLFTECGRYITGAHGVLITQAINIKNSYRHYVGVDANMSALMRPGMYDAYHHIDVLNKPSEPTQLVDVVGALCENNDKFAIQRDLPKIDEGDLLIIQDTGAHGHSMGFNYNGRLRPAELLLRQNGQVDLIRRAETLTDYFATLDVETNSITL